MPRKRSDAPSRLARAAVASLLAGQAEGFGELLRRALGRAKEAAGRGEFALPSSAAVADAERDCLTLADADLGHVASRASGECLAQARGLYCNRVAWAEAAAYSLRPAGRAEERCPTGQPQAAAGESEADPVNVSVALEAPQRAGVAFLILSYDKFSQVPRLVRRLYDPDRGLVLVHLDTKVASRRLVAGFRRWVRRGLGDRSRRVSVFSEFSVHRGGRSMLDVQLRAFELLLADARWDYYINLSDTHYPTEAASWMGAYLWLHRGSNYARITSTKYYDPTLQGGKDATYGGPRREDLYVACDRSLAFECEGRLFSLAPNEKYPSVLSGITAASGPEWVVLSRGFVDFVSGGVRDPASLAREIYEDLSALSIPEETFFQTVLMSSKFCHSIMRHDFLYLDLYDAPWRRSPNSDFPFQSPRTLNVTHLFQIRKDEPWFVRKMDEAVESALPLRQALDAWADRRGSWYWDWAGSDGAWSDVEPPWALSSALAAELEGAADGGTVEITRARRWQRPKRLELIHMTPAVLEVDLRVSEGSGGSGGGSAKGGRLRLTERVAASSSAEPSMPAPVAALRIGCQWLEDEYEFLGEVSVVPGASCRSLALVAYMSNVGFEGAISIVWSHGGQAARRSGGQIPKGYSMFVDRLDPPFGGLADGRWRVELTDGSNGRLLGARDFVVYAEGAGAERPALGWYREFFELSPGNGGSADDPHGSSVDDPP